jgi:hypothetical protein
MAWLDVRTIQALRLGSEDDGGRWQPVRRPVGLPLAPRECSGPAEAATIGGSWLAAISGLLIGAVKTGAGTVIGSLSSGMCSW